MPTIVAHRTLQQRQINSVATLVHWCSLARMTLLVKTTDLRSKIWTATRRGSPTFPTRRKFSWTSIIAATKTQTRQEAHRTCQTRTIIYHLHRRLPKRLIKTSEVERSEGELFRLMEEEGAEARRQTRIWPEQMEVGN